MDRPTLSTLPEDVLEEIFSQVAQGEKEDKHVEIFRTLCLVSRGLLRPARRRLYTAPFWRPYGARKEGILKLLTTLQAYPSTGRLVRSLRGVGRSLACLMCEKGSTDEHNAASSLVALLAACPELTRVEVVLFTREFIPDIAAALRLSFPTLTKVSIHRCWRSGKVGSPTPSLVRYFVELMDITTLDSFALDGMEPNGEDEEDELAGLPPLPFSVKNLRLGLFNLPFFNGVSCLPTAPTSLRLLVSRPTTPLLRPSFPSSKRPGLHLETFALVPSGWSTHMSFDDYGGDADGLLVPVDFFSLVPQIRILDLLATRSLSVKHIETLSQHSLRISHLYFDDCHWLADRPLDESRPGWQALLFPQKQLAALFSTFANLEYINLGIVPVNKHEALTEGFIEAFESRGIKLEYKQALCSDWMSSTCSPEDW